MNLSAHFLFFFFFNLVFLFFFPPAPPIREGNISLHAVAVFMFSEAQASPQPLADSSGLWALAAVVHVCSQPKLRQGNNSPPSDYFCFCFQFGSRKCLDTLSSKRLNECTDF